MVVAEATSAGVVFAFAYSNQVSPVSCVCVCLPGSLAAVTSGPPPTPDQISNEFSDTLTEKVENYSIFDNSSDVAELQKKV